MDNEIDTLLNGLKESGLSIYELSKKLDIHKGRMYTWINGTSKPKYDDVQKIKLWLNANKVEKSGVSEKSTLSEKDIILNETKEAGTSYMAQRREIKANGNGESLPVYYGNTRAGNIEVYSDDPEYQSPFAKLPTTLFPGCNHAERVSGDSMYPLIINQGLIIGKVIDKAGIIYGEKYGIHTKFGQNVCKYIHPSDKDGCIRLVSHSKLIPPQDISLDDITFCFRINYIVNPS